jgi:hypothetical protein
LKQEGGQYTFAKDDSKVLSEKTLSPDEGITGGGKWKPINAQNVERK